MFIFTFRKRDACKRIGRSETLRPVGQAVSSISYIAKLIDDPSQITTGQHAAFWVGTGMFVLAATVSAPAVAIAALIYGIAELISTLVTQKSLEENLIDRKK